MTEAAPVERLGIACESGGLRCSFVHGVLAGIGSRGIRAHAYAAVSASVLPAAFAAIGRASDPGPRFWERLHAARYSPGAGMSEMVLAGIAEYSRDLTATLYSPGAARLLVGTSRVVAGATAEQTQGPLASRLGREQLLAMARHDDRWARENLRPVTFDTQGTNPATRLTSERFPAVAYATTRMLHAWRIPAEVDGRAFIDGSYTIGCPTDALFALGCTRVLAISTGAGALFDNLYQTTPIEESDTLRVVRPAADLKDVGVDFTNASAEALARAYDLGREAGTACSVDWWQ